MSVAWRCNLVRNHYSLQEKKLVEKPCYIDGQVQNNRYQLCIIHLMVRRGTNLETAFAYYQTLPIMQKRQLYLNCNQLLALNTYVVDCIVGRIFFHSLWFILSFCSNSRMYISLLVRIRKLSENLLRVFQMGSLDSPSVFLRRSIILKYKKVSQRSL